MWQAELDLGQAELSVLRAHLSADETKRAERHRYERDRSRYAAARGWLRYLLAGYIGSDPRALVFVKDEHGKPRLGGRTDTQLSFNVSHSDGIALYAVACGRDVGVDIERMRGDVPLGVVRRYFSETEQESLTALPASLQLRAFMECWTRKEAYLKAVGIGLSGMSSSDAGRAGWSLHGVEVGPDYVAAVAVAGEAGVPRVAQSLNMNHRAGAGQPLHD
ncbi:MAG: 4'-phosphopantetheinyl transferase family protein [Candidatus Dormibacteria bacterium]